MKNPKVYAVDRKGPNQYRFRVRSGANSTDHDLTIQDVRHAVRILRSKGYRPGYIIGAFSSGEGEPVPRGMWYIQWITAPRPTRAGRYEALCDLV